MKSMRSTSVLGAEGGGVCPDVGAEVGAPVTALLPVGIGSVFPPAQDGKSATPSKRMRASTAQTVFLFRMAKPPFYAQTGLPCSFCGRQSPFWVNQ